MADKWAFCEVYVGNVIWDKESVNERKYIRISEKLIQAAKNIVYEKGVAIKINHPKNIGSLRDYLFRGNFVRISPIYMTTDKPAPLCRPDIELHSETEKGLEKLIKELGLDKENVSQE